MEQRGSFSLTRPKCGDDVRLIGFIAKPETIRKILKHQGELPHPAEKRSKAVMLAKVPLAVLSFALVSVFFGGRYKA